MLTRIKIFLISISSDRSERSERKERERKIKLEKSKDEDVDQIRIKEEPLDGK